MRRVAEKTYNERMQEMVEEYRASGEKWPTTARVIARWAIQTKRWSRDNKGMVDICAREISRALREEFHTDPQGRRVRTKHAALMPVSGSEEQMTLWDDIRTAPREFMERAFKGRRNQIVGDCVQLATDVDSYNENVSKGNPIPMLWDFTDDVEESKQTGELTDCIADQPLSPISIELPGPSEASRIAALPNTSETERSSPSVPTVYPVQEQHGPAALHH